MLMKVKKLHANAQLPQRNQGIGYDLFAPEDGFLDPLSRKLVRLGLAIEFDAVYAGLLLDRSGMGNKGITRLGGVIDPNYRGEWGVILYNTNAVPFKWNAGDRIIQVVFVPVGLGEPTWAEDLSVTDRGSRCLGSTGK